MGFTNNTNPTNTGLAYETTLTRLDMVEALRLFIEAAEGHRTKQKSHSYDCELCAAVENADRILRDAGYSP